MASLTGKSLNPVMNRRSVIASAAGLGAMSILAGCSSNGGDSGSASGDASFKIGTIGPLTGANASYGKSVTQGVELGCKDFSTKELPLASKAEDDQADGEKAVNAFNTLLDWGMQALVGPTTTGASVAVAAECGNDPKTFMITPSASSEDVTDGKDCVFQVCFTDPNQGVNAAKFLAQKYADEKFVLFYNSGHAYSSGIADSFKVQAAESKLEIVDEETFKDDSATSFTNQLTKAKQAGGMDGLLSVEGFDTSLAEGLLLMTPFSADDEKNADFVNAYKDKYGDTPDQFAADAYDGVHAVAEAVKEAGLGVDADPTEVAEKLSKAMLKITVDGLTGKLTWNDKGQVQKEPTAYVITDGKYVQA